MCDKRMTEIKMMKMMMNNNKSGLKPVCLSVTHLGGWGGGGVFPLAVTSGPLVCFTVSGVCLSVARCALLCLFFLLEDYSADRLCPRVSGSRGSVSHRRHPATHPTSPPRPPHLQLASHVSLKVVTLKGRGLSPEMYLI